MKKIICLFLALLLAFGMVGCDSCKKNNTDSLNDVPPLYDPNKGVDFNSEQKAFISDGKANYSIVISTNATECEVYAAEELQSFLKQATGATLRIVKDNNVKLNTAEKYLSVGKTTILEYVKDIGKYGVDYDSLNGDGFVIKTIDNLYIFDAGNDRGVLYSVYDFLEKFVGVKFIAYDCTYVPNDKKELLVHSLDIVEVPAFEYRSYMSPSISGHLDFGARMRMVHDYSQSKAKYGYNYLQDFYTNNAHNFTDLVPVDTYFEKHPEWFSIDKTAICLTSGIKNYEFDNSVEESVAKVVLEVLKEQIKENSSAKYFNVCQEDLATSCSCSACNDSDELNGGKSGTLMVFLNAISKELESWLKTYAPYREVYLVTFAYEYTVNPPVKTVEKNGEVEYLPYNEHVIARDNVCVKIAPIQQCYYHSFKTNCSKSHNVMKIFNGWKVVCKNFLLWDYACNYRQSLWHLPNYSAMRDNLLLYQDMGVIYAMTQGMHLDSSAYQEQLKIYMLSKMMWCPNRDVNALIKEFNYYYFGEEIAPYIDEYMATTETHYAVLDETLELGFHTHTYSGNSFLDTTYYSKSYLEKLVSILDEAMGKTSKLDLSNAEKDKIEVRILRVLIMVQQMVIRNYSAYYDMSTELDYVKDFVKNAERVGVLYVEDTKTLAQFKESYNIL